MSDQISQISAQLVQTKSIEPSAEWLTQFAASQKSTTPLPALVQSALYRLLLSDITNTLAASPSTCFPRDILDVNCRERQLTGPIVVQVLSVEDLSKSRWEQIEAIEAMERGEQKKGREIIRVTRNDENEGTPTSELGNRQATSGGPHKVLLQDAAGLNIWALELKSVDCINLNMLIGTKIVLRRILVARGMVLLENSNVSFLGGKIEELHKMWREKRKEELKAQIQPTETGSA